MRIMRIGLVSALSVVAGMFLAPPQSHAANPKKIESGKTQVVAKIDGREITTSELRSEMALLGISPNAENAERIALENIVNRSLLAKAARAANIHKKPETLRRMKAAQEQALADVYLSAVSQPPEPTMAEIEDYMIANPSLFTQRRIYTFSVLSLPTSLFEDEDLTALFDKSSDFAVLTGHFDNAGAAYSQTSTTQPSGAFPDPIRRQLAEYKVRDNIVIKGGGETQIMKIMAVKSAPLPQNQAPALARRALLQQNANERATRIVERLKRKAKIAYYRKNVAPLPADAER